MSILTKRVLLPMLAAVASCMLAGPIVATASASNGSIIRIVNHYGPIVGQDEHHILAAERAYKRAGNNYKPIIRALRHEVSDLRHFASQLKAQSASGQIAARGRDDIATGAREIARSYGRFASELKSEHGPKGVTKQQFNANRRLAHHGHDKIVTGIKLLKRL